MENNIIYLKPEYEVKESNFGTGLIFVIVLLMFFASSFISNNIEESSASLLEKEIFNIQEFIKQTSFVPKISQEIITEEIPKPTIDDIIIKELKKQGLSLSHFPMIKAIIDQESKFKSKVTRYEAKWERDYNHLVENYEWLSKEERKLTFSSIGLMQIGYVLHKDFCGIETLDELFEEEINIACGVKIINNCLEKNSRNYCIKRYNGAGRRAELYRNKILHKIKYYS